MSKKRAKEVVRSEAARVSTISFGDMAKSLGRASGVDAASLGLYAAPSEIKGMHDSGKRQEFSTGAIRDAAEGKPRMELMTPAMLRYMGADLEYLRLHYVADFMDTNDVGHLELLLSEVIRVENDVCLIERCGVWLGKGAEKYADRNWELGLPVSRYLSSLLRHLLKWERDEDDEDHAAAIQFNIMGIIFTREQVKKGLLPAELDDWPPKHWVKKETK
jgi:hypothetical protein